MKSIVKFLTEKASKVKYYFGQEIYSIKDDEFVGDMSGRDMSDSMDSAASSPKKILDLIDHWVKHPENSEYADIKASDMVPIFYVFTMEDEDEDEQIVLDDTFYIYKDDAKYKDKILKCFKSTDFDSLEFNPDNIQIVEK